MVEMKNDFAREERNMLFLRHPYLTSEQTDGYMKELKAMQPEKILFLTKLRDLKFSRQYTFEDALSHLRVKEAWD